MIIIKAAAPTDLETCSARGLTQELVAKVLTFGLKKKKELSFIIETEHRILTCECVIFLPFSCPLARVIYSLAQWAPTFLGPESGFVEDNFSTAGVR